MQHFEYVQILFASICSNSIVKVELDINMLLLIVIKKQEYKKQEPGGNSFEKTLDLANIKREALPKKKSDEKKWYQLIIGFCICINTFYVQYVLKVLWKFCLI